jgi:hypothetical protein
LGANLDSPFARDASGKLIQRSYWPDMTDRTLVIVTRTRFAAFEVLVTSSIRRATR